jgi:hypothetical protein
MGSVALVTTFSHYVAAQQGVRSYRLVLEHVIIVILVIIITHYVGKWVAAFCY